MAHVLDNPVWNALISGNKDLAKGNEKVKYFPKSVAAFAGLKDNTAGNFQALHDIPGENTFAVVCPGLTDIPPVWNVFVQVGVYQMVLENISEVVNDPVKIVALGAADVPAMLALTAVTTPGPFSANTIDFGNYFGIYKGSQLIAMIGERLHPFEYVEVSAVCTHPGHRGKGYASRMINNQVQHIFARKKKPFLHVKTDNEAAIRLYERLGFSIRKQMEIYVLKKFAR